MVYNISGTRAAPVYAVSGSEATAAYTISGDMVYPDGDTLKVMTYNVGQWYIGSGTNVPTQYDQVFYDLQNGMISRDAPDVLLIEEYWKIFSQTGRTARSMLEQYYPYIQEVGGDSGYFGHCICSKYPFSNYTPHYYSNDAQRYYADWTITVYGKTVHFIVTHLGLTVAARTTQVSELVTYLRTLDRFVCCGDFNTPSGYGSVPDSTSELTPLFNAGFNLANCGDLGDFITCYGESVAADAWKGWIDNVCTSPNIEIISAYVDETKKPLFIAGSIPKVDHMPFMATIQL